LQVPKKPHALVAGGNQHTPGLRLGRGSSSPAPCVPPSDRPRPIAGRDGRISPPRRYGPSQSGIEYTRDSFVPGELQMPLPGGLGCLALFADDLDQHALAAPSVELAIKNLLPRTKVEFTRRDCDYNLPPHDLALHMGIGIVLAGSVVTVARDWLMRCQPFQPSFVVGVQSPLIIVDKNGCGNVHGIDERYALLNVSRSGRPRPAE
jgi:hypothetical protein